VTAPDLRALAGRLGLRAAHGGFRGACPSCGYFSSFTLSLRSGTLLWWCASCSDREALTRAVRAAAEDVWIPPVSPPQDRSWRSPVVAQQRALVLWDTAVPARGTLVERYLHERHIPHIAYSPALRFIARCPHPCGARLPAMVAGVRNAAGNFEAVHRTFLAPDGRTKAAIDLPRASLGPLRGAAVHLDIAAPAMCVGEGIETTGSAALLLKLPGWAAISAGGLEALELPRTITSVTIAADHDLPGQRAADAAARRWRSEGRTVRITLPKRPGADFNDLLMKDLADG